MLVRIVTADFYMHVPHNDHDVTYSDFRGAAIQQVPIVRIFGPTDTGDLSFLLTIKAI